MGLFLFLLYINDLPDSLQSQVRLFADDTAVYLTVQGQDDNAKLQVDLDLLQKWEQEWDMEFNPSKCQVVHITRSYQHFILYAWPGPFTLWIVLDILV